jgi:hypothetical protein
MTTRTNSPPWRRLAFVGLALVVAAAVAGVAALEFSLWAAAAMGVLVAEAVSIAVEAWDARHFPDRVVILGAGVTDRGQLTSRTG